MLILVDGRVIPCCVDACGKYILGDVHNESLEKIWNGDKAVALRTMLLEGKVENIPLCKDCSYGPSQGDIPGFMGLVKRTRSLFAIRKFLK